MQLMKPFRKFKLKTNSLFIRLFASFLIVIVMLVSFNYFSMTFSKNKVRDEIINYNTLNLKTTTDNYEKEFELIKNQLINFFFNENVQLLYADQNSINYYITSKTVQDIRQMTLNPKLYVNNVILYYKKSSLVLDKNSMSRDSTYFGKFYASNDYPYEFWRNQFNDTTQFRVYPPAPFYDIPFRNDYNPLGLQFPVIVKTSWYQDFYMAAFLDVKKMFQAFHMSINDNFFILDGDGSKLFSSSSSNADIGPLPAFDKTKSYIKQGNYYFFYKMGSVTGLTYVNVVPDAYVASQVRLNVSLVTLLIVTIGISIVTSLLFSISFNHPIQRIIESIKRYNVLVPVRSRISEFNMIGNQIMSIHKDLSQKNSLLKSFAYMSSLKKIRNNIEMDFTDKPFAFVVFELTYKRRNEDRTGTEQNWAYYVKEFVDYNFKLHFREPLTFQIETNQILSFVFMDETDKPALRSLLEKLKIVFEFDKEEGFVTIAVSSLYAQAAQMTEAYEEALSLIRQRRLNGDTQIMTSGQAAELAPLLLSPQQEQEFYLNLQAGNETETLQIVQRLLLQMNKRSATSAQFYRFAEEIIQKTVKTLTTMQVDFHHLTTPIPLQERLSGCHTFEQLSSFLAEFLTAAMALVSKKKEERDPITAFVAEYLEQHYDGDITLDLIADKLNITSGYLSTYFKEKTGVNFIDYLNDLRIRKAKEMLLHSNCKIQEVARKAGYQNMNSFNRMFKKFSGITPSEFRKSPS